MLAASSVPFTATIPPRQTVYGEVVRPPTSSTRWNRCTNRYGVSQFAFADEQFMGHGTSGRERALGIAQQLLRRNLHFDWYFETRSSDVDRETFSVLRDAGLRAVFMGIESGYDPARRLSARACLFASIATLSRFFASWKSLPVQALSCGGQRRLSRNYTPT